MVEKTLDLFPTEPDPSLENNSKLAQWVEPNAMASKLASSFEFSRFSPAAATNAERLYPHAPLLKAVATTKENVQPKSVHRRLWLALNFPLLPIPPDVSRSIEPTVVTETAGNVQKVLAKNRAAQQLGIERGMSLNSAYALSNHLQVRKRDPASEQQALERLATWASQYTSSVSIEKPDALLLEVKGSLRLFGGARALRQKMFAQLHEMEVVATAALAPTSRAALWLARSAGPYPNVPNLTILPRYLEKLPVSCLRWPENAYDLLQDLGVRTVGECLRLPRDGFARRLGYTLLQELDQAAGRVAQPRLQYVPRERYKARRDSEVEIESSTALMHVLGPLLDDLELFFRSRTVGLQALKILLRHRELEDTRIILRFVVPVYLKKHVASVLSERLERLQLPAPVLSVRMMSGPLQQLNSQALNGKLFGPMGEQTSEGTARLIDKLRARLGNEAVYSLRLTADHRPEHAYKITKYFHMRGNSSEKIDSRSAVCDLQPENKRNTLLRTDSNLQPSVCEAVKRPLWLLSQPEALSSKHDLPYLNGALILESGPERIEGGWWDNADIRRDYYVAREKNGMRLWIFCERGKWFLHGRFG